MSRAVGCCLRTVHKALRAGELAGFREGRWWYVTPEALAEWITALRVNLLRAMGAGSDDGTRWQNPEVRDAVKDMSASHAALRTAKQRRS